MRGLLNSTPEAFTDKSAIESYPLPSIKYGPFFGDMLHNFFTVFLITWYYSDDKTSIDLDALTEITETSESNTVDRGSHCQKSG